MIFGMEPRSGRMGRGVMEAPSEDAAIFRNLSGDRIGASNDALQALYFDDRFLTRFTENRRVFGMESFHRLLEPMRRLPRSCQKSDSRFRPETNSDGRHYGSPMPPGNPAARQSSSLGSLRDVVYVSTYSVRLERNCNAAPVFGENVVPSSPKHSPD